MKTPSTRRVLAAVASALVLTSALALPTAAYARKGMNCGFVLVRTTPMTWLWTCSQGV